MKNIRNSIAFLLFGLLLSTRTLMADVPADPIEEEVLRSGFPIWLIAGVVIVSLLLIFFLFKKKKK